MTKPTIFPGKVVKVAWGRGKNVCEKLFITCPPGQLAAYGYKITTVDPLSAHLWLLNSCTVKNPAEDGFRNEIKKAQQLGKYVVLAGCVPQGQPKSEYIKGGWLIKKRYRTSYRY